MFIVFGTSMLAIELIRRLAGGNSTQDPEAVPLKSRDPGSVQYEAHFDGLDAIYQGALEIIGRSGDPVPQAELTFQLSSRGFVVPSGFVADLLNRTQLLELTYEDRVKTKPAFKESILRQVSAFKIGRVAERKWESLSDSLRKEIEQLRRDGDAVERELQELKEKCTPTQSEVDLMLHGRRDHESRIEVLSREIEALTAQLAECGQHRDDELRKRIHTELGFGYARIQWAGFDKQARNLTVAVEFINTDDVELARSIQRIFEGNISGATPWNVLDIKRTDWSENPSDARVVLICDDAKLAKGIQETFNEHRLIDEAVKWVPGFAAPAPSPSQDINSDVRFVIFPKQAKT